MKIVMMSDVHGDLPKPEGIPECDVVGLCGDTVPLEYQDDDVASIAWFCLEFVPWTDKLRCKKVLLIAGNHDFFLYNLMYGPTKEDGTRKIRSASEVLKKLLPGNNKGKHKLVYLRDSSYEFEGKKFYGTPWVSGLPGWAFNVPEMVLEEDKFAKIPNNLDVLMTHIPPNLCDMGTVLQHNKYYGCEWGSDALKEVLLDKNVKYTFCGHVHTGQHVMEEYKDDCNVVNVSIKDEDYIVRTHSFDVYEI